MSSFTFRFPIKDLQRNLRSINTLKNKQQTAMKILNTAFGLATFTHISQGVAIQMQLSRSEPLTSLNSNLVAHASDGTTSRVENVMNGAVDLALRAQDAGMTNWWGWYLIGIVDATADLVTDAVSDGLEWGVDAAEGGTRFIGGLMADTHQFITDAAEDVGTWGGHFSEREFTEIAGDLHSWVDDIERILTEGIRVAADGSISFVGDVTDDMGEWITEYATDFEDIFDGTYCFEHECPPEAQGLAQTGFYLGGWDWSEHELSPEA